MPARPATVRRARHATPVVRYQERPSLPARQHRRALATNSAAWRKIRAQVLQEEPLCKHCQAKAKPRLTPACVVDHVNGNAMDNRRENLQGLCERCHNRKTARENGGFGNPHARPSFGDRGTLSPADGFTVPTAGRGTSAGSTVPRPHPGGGSNL